MGLWLPVLFHPSKPISRLSGISYFIDRDHDFYTLQVPWDEHTGIIRPKNRDIGHDNKHLLATALRDEVHDEPHPDRLRGLVVHDRCWQVLCRHGIWQRSGGDIDQIMRALLSRTARDWEKSPLIPSRLELNEHRRNPIGMEESGSASILSYIELYSYFYRSVAQPLRTIPDRPGSPQDTQEVQGHPKPTEGLSQLSPWGGFIPGCGLAAASGDSGCSRGNWEIPG